MVKTTRLLSDPEPRPVLQFYRKDGYLHARYHGYDLAKTPLDVGEERLVDWQNHIAATIAKANHDEQLRSACTRR